MPRRPARRPLARAFALAMAVAIAGMLAVVGCSPGLPEGSPSGPVPGAPDRPIGPTEEAMLVRVVDGDTIRVIVDGTVERVRLVGIDTPEPNPPPPATAEPYAEAATAAAAKLLEGGRLVLERDVSERDRYGRLLRHAWTEADGHWTLVSLELVAGGFAEVTTYPPDVRHAEALVAAQRAARDAGRGLWGTR